MTLGASVSNNVIHELAYDPAEPSPAVGMAASWAEQHLRELEKQLSSIYPFRTASET